MHCVSKLQIDKKKKLVTINLQAFKKDNTIYKTKIMQIWGFFVRDVKYLQSHPLFNRFEIVVS